MINDRDETFDTSFSEIDEIVIIDFLIMAARNIEPKRIVRRKSSKFFDNEAGNETLRPFEILVINLK